MLRFKFIFITLFVFTSISTYAQKSISKTEKHAVIQQIKKLIDSQYVLAEKTAFINQSLDSLNKSAAYKKIKDHQTFADQLSKDLVAISKDRHFKIQYNPELAKSRLESSTRQQETEEQEDTFDINYWYSQKTNFGMQKVEVLEGNIGYLKLTFFDPLSWVRSVINGAMAFLSNTDALIIDIRGHNGGYTSSSYLGSFFFDEKPVIWNVGYNRPSARRDTTYTHQEIDGQRYLNKPVYILVDENSFSRAEEFAYSMKHHNKATIIGQATAGASHSIDFIAMDENFLIQLPVSSSIHPVTKTDWEGKGVIPHIKTEKGETFKKAYLMALDMLLANNKDEFLGVHYTKLKQQYKDIEAKINNQ